MSAYPLAAGSQPQSQQQQQTPQGQQQQQQSHFGAGSASGSASNSAAAATANAAGAGTEPGAGGSNGGAGLYPTATGGGVYQTADVYGSVSGVNSTGVGGLSGCLSHYYPYGRLTSTYDRVVGDTTSAAFFHAGTAAAGAVMHQAEDAYAALSMGVPAAAYGAANYSAMFAAHPATNGYANPWFSQQQPGYPWLKGVNGFGGKPLSFSGAVGVEAGVTSCLTMLSRFEPSVELDRGQSNRILCVLCSALCC